MSNSAGLIELVSAALAKAGIPHECYATLRSSEGRPVNVSVAIPSEKNPLAAIMCGIVEEYEELFLEQYEGVYDIIILGLKPLTVYAATMLLGPANDLKRNRDKPMLCIAVMCSRSKRLRKRPLCDYLQESYDEAFVGREIDRLPRFVKDALSNPDFEVKTERLWLDKRGIKRVTIQMAPLMAVLWNSRWAVKEREEGV